MHAVKHSYCDAGRMRGNRRGNIQDRVLLPQPGAPGRKRETVAHPAVGRIRPRLCDATNRTVHASC